MDVAPGSKWFIASAEWLKRWKQYIGFDGDQDMIGEHPGPCNNEDIIDEPEG